MKNNATQLSFKVSSGLKNIIGRDLISDKYIAIFELVKNSYDAQAHNVRISFAEDSNGKSVISIIDDGYGMNYSDIVEKWLFVAYSEKKKRNRKKTDYRNEFKRNVAGAKGVGRFSCDRLGAKLKLITKKANETYAHFLDIDWNNFEYDDQQEFIDIPVDYYTGEFPYENTSGAILEISELREEWDRDSIIHLKKSLMKLISPDFHDDVIDKFEISISAPNELATDEKLKAKGNVASRDLVNGVIINDVFEKLNIKTTNITLDVSKDGKTIETILTDRGQVIFKIKERNNKYRILNNIHISLFYLNRAAKNNFTRLMGVEPVNYGSVFVYKNGFRINPYGEPNEDFFGINQRKAQGYNRFLGTREIMGRISIVGDNEGFIETSSRAHGFIVTESYEKLSELFLQKVLKVLEKYVVNIINWNNPLNVEDEIRPTEVADKIISEFADISSRNDIISIEYDHELFSKNSKVNTDGLSSSIAKLQKVAEKTQNKAVADLVSTVKKHTDAIKKQNQELEQENKEKTAALNTAKEQANVKDTQIYFLKNAAKANSKNLLNGMHTVFTQSEAIEGNIELIEELIVSGLNESELIILINEIKKSNQKINKLSHLAIHGGQNLKAEKNEDVLTFIKEYLNTGLAIRGIQSTINAPDKEYSCFFDSASIGLIIDNIYSNSLKAHSDQLNIIFTNNIDSVCIGFYDNGTGLNIGISPENMFEYGATTTNTTTTRGFGIGLCHIKQLACEMGGDVIYDEKYHDGFGLIVRLKK